MITNVFWSVVWVVLACLSRKPEIICVCIAAATIHNGLIAVLYATKERK